MKINSENIEQLIFEKLEGNLSDAEINELNNFLSLNPQFHQLEEEWQISYLEKNTLSEDYQLTTELQKISSARSWYATYKWPFVSLSGILIVVWFSWNSHEEKIQTITKPNFSVTTLLHKKEIEVQPSESVLKKVVSKGSILKENSITPAEPSSLELSSMEVEIQDTLLTESQIVPEVSTVQMKDPEPSMEPVQIEKEKDNSDKKENQKKKKRIIATDPGFQRANSSF